MNERQPVAFCDADEDCYGDNQCSTLSACPAGVNCCVLAPLGEACPPHFALCAANTQQPRPFCDADPDCYGDSNCCGPFCSGNEACRAGVDCCVTFPTLVAPPVYPPRPPLPKRPPSSPPGAAAFRGFGPRARTGRGGFVFEFGTPVDSEDESFFTLQGDQRAYLARDFKSLKWEDIRYDRLRLLGKTLHVTVNVSGVGCGCNAAIYLVNMPQSNATGSHYCDIQFPDPERCLEIDLLEGNIKGVATTLHTRAGKASDGTCNQWGCGSRWGPDDKQCKFGSGSPNVDSTQPFELLASFDEKGHMKVSIVQKGQVRQLWGVESSGNYPSTAVDEEASLKVKEALMAGMVLVTSLWDAEGNGMAWLDGGCNTAYPHCELDRAIFSISNLWIEDTHPTPPPPLTPVPSAPFNPPAKASSPATMASRPVDTAFLPLVKQMPGTSPSPPQIPSLHTSFPGYHWTRLHWILFLLFIVFPMIALVECNRALLPRIASQKSWELISSHGAMVLPKCMRRAPSGFEIEDDEELDEALPQSRPSGSNIKPGTKRCRSEKE